MALFITFEGMEASGKSTQAALLAERVRLEGRETVLTREPGGTEAGRSIRELILHSGALAPMAELLLFLADRSQHVETLIRPSLASGAVVISDRYYHSTLAYQAGGRRINPDTVRILNEAAVNGLEPDHTFLMDIPVEDAFFRKSAGNMVLDRIEREKRDFHESVRQSFLALAVDNSRITVLDGRLDKMVLKEMVWQVVKGLLDRA